MIVIIDYGLGNIGSIANMFKKIGVEAKISSDPRLIENADKLILPGVGSFDNGIENLSQHGFIEILRRKVIEKKTPILGICLGMQLMTRGSEEGKMSGLGWVDAETVKFFFTGSDNALKIPHMGWNTISPKKQNVLLNDLYLGARFYFVHSYHVKCSRPDDVLMETRYGFDFTSAFQFGNIFGVQFHPEKSHRFGMKLLSNFAGM